MLPLCYSTKLVIGNGNAISAFVARQGHHSNLAALTIEPTSADLVAQHATTKLWHQAGYWPW